MTSVTDELRRLLDERGAEWTEPTDEYWELLGGMPTRNYVTIIGEMSVEEALDGTLAVYHLTPEQAVAATLGRGTCKRKWRKDGYAFCSNCGYNITGPWANYCPNCGREVVNDQ